MNFLQILAFTGLVSLTSLVMAKVSLVPIEDLKPSKQQMASTRIITQFVDKLHYKDLKLDDEMSADILKRYIESLDANKSFFIQSDIESFSVFETRLDEYILRSRLDPPFAIFRIYRQRVEQRIKKALKLLDEKYDFTKKETYQFDRTEGEWSQSSEQLDVLWHQRVKNDILSLRLAEKKEDEIKEKLTLRYKGILRRVKQLDSEDVYQTFINAFTLSLEPHTSYMSPRESENFDINMSLSLEGIGAVLKIENEYTTIQKVVVGGPAKMTHELFPGDRIVGVGQDKKGQIEDIVGWRLQDVVDKIRGNKGTTVRLKVLPEEVSLGGPTKIVTIVRDKIKLENQAAKKSIIEGLDGMQPLKIGVIELPTFYRDFSAFSRGEKDFRSTTRDVRRLLQELKDENVDGVVIDLRDNGGGSLTEATELTGLFIKSGPVVQVKKTDGQIDIERDPDPSQVYAGPLAVLINRYSASASEIFAGAIQDYGRGLILGETTFGKGTVQTLIDLDRFSRNSDHKLGRLRLTMAQFFRVNGGSTQFKGVVPDIPFVTASKEDTDGERSLDNALPWAKIEPLIITPDNFPYLQTYQKRNKQRSEKNLGFKYLLEEIHIIAKVKSEKTVTLNQVERQKEWDLRKHNLKEKKNRFRVAMGLEPEEDDDPTTKKKANPEKDEADVKLIRSIELNEAARVLADYIDLNKQKSALH